MVRSRDTAVQKVFLVRGRRENDAMEGLPARGTRTSSPRSCGARECLAISHVPERKRPEGKKKDLISFATARELMERLDVNKTKKGKPQIKRGQPSRIRD